MDIPKTHEFLPPVCWSDKHNTINAATMHHINEGRWLKNAPLYLGDYINFFLFGDGNYMRYSSSLIFPAYEMYKMRGEPLPEGFLEKCCEYYKKWEDANMTECGLFWSYDDRDAMEYTISGTHGGIWTKGIRPTLNSYMYAEANAISNIAKEAGDEKTSDEYAKKAASLKKRINTVMLTSDGYRAIHPKDEEFSHIEKCFHEQVRELIDYIPWIYSIAPKGYEHVFDYLDDDKIFYTKFGLTTADQGHERFMFPVDHECLWNGYIWPFATSQTLDALRSLMQNYGKKEKRDMYMKLLRTYAKSHKRTNESGKEIMWIDEVIDPRSGEWSSREILKNFGWKKELGGYERGKDYNHSTFCNLLLSYLTGIKINKDGTVFEPEVPDGWDWFRIDNIYANQKNTALFMIKQAKSMARQA